MIIKRFIVFSFIYILAATILLGLDSRSANASFDCLRLTVDSAQADKDFCKKELANIEAQLAELLKKQKEQQKNYRHH
jgi:hypothetical protein